MEFHRDPRQCLESLEQRISDGGRMEYLEREIELTGEEPDWPTGDCAVVALTHAAFRQPTAQSYMESKNELRSSTRPWMYRIRRSDEELHRYLTRRVKEWWRPPDRNPIHGTPSHATSMRLRMMGYQIIYPNDERSWYCICNMQCTYVLDVQMPGDHTMTVHQRVAYTTVPFDPSETEVRNVHGLDPMKTKTLKAWALYKKDEELWFKEWMDSGSFHLPDWDKRPKLEDYL